MVDSAVDELLAGEMGRTQLGSNLKLITPECKVLLRDKAHAARRPMSRPWSKCKVLSGLIQKFVSGRGSPARMIQNSLEFRRWFKKNLRAAGWRRAKDNANLRAAKHRFESLSKPLQRTCLHLFSRVRTMVQIANLRNDEFGQMAKAFLESTRPDELVLLAMCADAADEMLLFIRFHDDETADVACIAQMVVGTLTNLKELFGESAACLTRPCFTSHMLKALQRPMVFTVRGKVS